MTRKELKKSSIYEKTEYKKKCVCGKTNRVFTQYDNNNPEYTTIVYVECKCKQLVEFELPVN